MSIKAGLLGVGHRMFPLVGPAQGVLPTEESCSVRQVALWDSTLPSRPQHEHIVIMGKKAGRS